MNHQSFCLIGLVVTEIFKECSISSQGTPGMSTGFHMKMLTCSLRKLMSVSSYLGSRPAPIRAVLDWSLGTRVASRVGISRSSGEICYEVVMQSYMRMEMSIASASV